MATKHVRQLDANGDDTFGRGLQNFLFGTDATVQRLGCDFKVILGEWFWDESDGVPWWKKAGSDVAPILGEMPGNQPYAQAVLTARALHCNGVASVTSFDFAFDRNTRAVSAAIRGTSVDGGPLAVTASPP